MEVLTKRASEEVFIDKPMRMVFLETTGDHVTLGVLDPDEEFEEGYGEVSPHSDRGTVKVMAPYGEEIEIET
jgi:hypothetical protein